MRQIQMYNASNANTNIKFHTSDFLDGNFESFHSTTSQFFGILLQKLVEEFKNLNLPLVMGA